MYDFKIFILLAFCSHRKIIEDLNNRIYIISHANNSANDRRFNFVARKFTNKKLKCFRAVTLKQHRVLRQQGKQHSEDSQKMECETLTDSGNTLEYSSGHSDREPQTVDCELRTVDRL